MNDLASIPEKNSITWTSRGLAFRNRTVLISLGVVSTISVGFVAFLIVGIALADEEFDFVPKFLGVIAIIWIGFSLALYLIGFLFFGGKVPMEVTVDEKGITQTMHSKVSKAVNLLSMLAIFSGNSRGLTTAGAGMIAQSRQTEFVKWKWIQELRLRNPRTREYQIRNRWRPLLVLHLPEEGSEQIIRFINEHITKKGLKKLQEDVPTEIRVILAIFAIILGGYLLLPFPLEVPPLPHLAVPALALFTILLRPRWRVPLGWVLFTGTGLVLLYSWRNDPPHFSQPGVGATVVFQLILYGFFLFLGFFSGLGKLTPKAPSPVIPIPQAS